jgi:hypothetical protein
MWVAAGLGRTLTDVVLLTLASAAIISEAVVDEAPETLRFRRDDGRA